MIGRCSSMKFCITHAGRRMLMRETVAGGARSVLNGGDVDLVWRAVAVIGAQQRHVFHTNRFRQVQETRNRFKVANTHRRSNQVDTVHPHLGRLRTYPGHPSQSGCRCRAERPCG